MSEGCIKCSYFHIAKNVDGSFSDEFAISNWMVDLNQYALDRVHLLTCPDGTRKAIYFSADVMLAKSPSKTADIFSELKKALGGS